MRITSIIFVVALTAVTAGAHACDPATGERVQSAYFSWGAESLESWKTQHDAIWLTKLPTGQTLALQVSEPTPEVLMEAFGGRRYNAEIVQVNVLDASTEPYTLVYTSLGGANSSSAIPSAHLPSEVLSNLRLNLSNPVCVAAESLVADRSDDGSQHSSGLRGEAMVFPDVVSARSRLTRR